MFGVGRLLVPVAGLLITWYSPGVRIHLMAWLAVLVTRYASLERYDPWVEPGVRTNASD